MFAGKSQSTTASELASAPFEAMPGDWHVLHTRSRQEKIISEELEVRSSCIFFPRFGIRGYTAGENRWSMSRCFPDMCFSRARSSRPMRPTEHAGSSRIIPVADQEQLESELKSLWIALESRVALDPFPYLRCGMRVEVRSGPLRGVQGLIETRIGVSRLVLQVQMLGRAVALEVDGALLEPA